MLATGARITMTELSMNGKVKNIDLSGRVLATNDETTAVHIFKWNTEPLDEYFKKTKVGYYLTVKFDSDTYMIKSAHYWPEGKEIWSKLPNQNQQKPQWLQGQRPSNTKMIAAQVLLKAYVDLWVNTNTPDQVLFSDAREDIRKAVEEDLVWLMRIGGA